MKGGTKMFFLQLLLAIVILTALLIFTAITGRIIKKEDKEYMIINIDDWKEMNIEQYKLEKKKAILEREIINILLQSEEEELEI